MIFKSFVKLQTKTKRITTINAFLFYIMMIEMNELYKKCCD